MTDEERILFMDLMDKFMKLSVENQTTLYILTKGLKEVEDSVGKSDSTVFSLLHRLMAEKKDIERTHSKLKNFIDTFSKREYTNAEIEAIGGPLKEIYKLAGNYEIQKGLDCTEKIVETHAFVTSIKRRWKWIVTFAERIIKLILYLHGLGG